MIEANAARKGSLRTPAIEHVRFTSERLAARAGRVKKNVWRFSTAARPLARFAIPNCPIRSGILTLAGDVGFAVAGEAEFEMGFPGGGDGIEDRTSSGSTPTSGGGF